MAQRGRPRKRRPEIITRATSMDNLRLMDYLPDPDRVLDKLGVDPDTAFRDIMADDHLTAVMGTRQAAIKGMDWDLTLGDSEPRILRFCEDMFLRLNRNHNGMGVPRAIDDMLQANPWGMAVLEVIKATGDLWWPVELKGKPFRYFTFNNDNELRFLTAASLAQGVEIPEMTALLCRHWITSSSFDNPYGDKLLSKSYWPVYFKRNGMQWYNKFIEKFGIPWITAAVERGMTETDQETLADNLANLVQDGVAVIPNSVEIKPLEVSSKGDSSNTFLNLFHYMDSALSKVWLGQTLTTEMGEVGSYAASKTHQGVKDERKNQDKLMVINAFQTMIDWFVKRNFGDVPSPVFSLIEPLGVNIELANRTQILSAAGVKHLKPFYMRNFGLEEDEFEIKEAEVNPMFAKLTKSPALNLNDPIDKTLKQVTKDTGGQDVVDLITKNLTAEQLQEQAEGMLKPIIKLINEANSLDDIRINLLSVYPDMNTDLLEDMLGRAVFVSEAIGRLGK